MSPHEIVRRAWLIRNDGVRNVGKVESRATWRTTPVSTELFEMQLHPLPIRIMHWINAVTMIVMIGSGWKIYNDEVIFGWLHFPESITIGK